MLRNIKLCGIICNELVISNKCFRRIKLQGLKCQYQYRLLTSGKDTCKKPGSSDRTDERPHSDTAPRLVGDCKIASGKNLSSTSSRFDHVRRTNCDWEEEQKKTKFQKNFLLVSGLILCALAAIPLYRKLNPRLVDNRKKKGEEEAKKSKRPWVITKTPSSSSAIPGNVPYVLIGGGTASFSAFRAIKSKEPKAKVLVIGNEPYYPYMRPPLSKEMYYVQDRNVAKKLRFKQWNGTERSLFYEPDDFYLSCESLEEAENGGVAVARGWTVKRIDATNRVVYLEDNKAIRYEKCLIATGAKPKNHPAFEDLDESISQKVTLYRNIFDFEELEGIIEDGAKSIAVVGGSFLGSEIACALARRGKKKKLKVTQIIKESGNMGKILPEYLSKWTTRKVKKEGVTVIADTLVEDVDLKDSKLTLTLNNGNVVTADHVVLALGVTPNTDLAKASNLETDKELGGFLVNAELEARSNLFVAGDCACFYDAKLGRRRVEHHDHAVVSGRLAGENMTGAGKPYWHQSMFWSDLGPDVGYEAIGVIDASLPTVGVYAKVTKKDKPRSVTIGDSDGMRSSTEEMATENGEGKEESKESEGEGHEAEAEKDEGAEEKDEDSDEATEGEGEGEDESEGEDSGEGEEGEKVSDSSGKKKTEEEYGKGVIFYLREGTVVGIVLWNVFNRMNVARQVLSEDKRYEDLNEVAKLFNIHKD